jgi:hypothetical protein
MNREKIIQMAREAGATPYTNRHYPDRPVHSFMPEALERFAALVAAAEREACAKVVEQTKWSNWFQADCAAAIRARGETK